MVELLPLESLIKTGDVDEAAWNYRPLLGWIQRVRFRLAQSLLAGRHYERLLEIGYGSGVFMPTLSRMCDALYGADVHEHSAEVTEKLREHGLSAKLHVAGAAALPFESDFFDGIVAVSCLEFMDDLDGVCAELSRVLAPGGALVVVRPGHSPALDWGFKLLTGRSAQEYGDRRARVEPALRSRFEVLARVGVPSGAVGSFAPELYAAYLLSDSS